MPPNLTYPGVYIEEIPSGVRTITGVATSITAFVGSAQRGPTDRPQIINSYGDFERIYGGLWKGSRLGYAVRDFYLNGGSQAVIARLVGANAVTRNIVLDAVQLDSASPGTWTSGLRAATDVDGLTDDKATALGLTKADLFNLTVRDENAGTAERHVNLSLRASSRRIDKVLASESQLVTWAAGVAVPDQAAPAPAADDVTTAENTLAQLRRDTPSDKANIDIAVAAVATAANAAVVAAAGADGAALTLNDFLPNGGQANRAGLFQLEFVDLFNLLCIPPYAGGTDVDTELLAAASVYCEDRRAMLIVDSPSTWVTTSQALTAFTDPNNDPIGIRSSNAALFFPRLREQDPLSENQWDDFAPCGAVAGIFARTDTQRGVWKAPAGTDATLVGVPQLTVDLTDAENGELNPVGMNCLRSLRDAGRVVWGSRTLRGSDGFADEYKYIPVRRTALFLEESLYRGTQWVVFEPNDEPLWSQIRLNVGAFMHGLFRQGAFQGTTPSQAYLVKCDSETTTQDDQNSGIVNIVVGFAPLKPAEFVVIKIQQLSGQIEV